ncbi:hypothetical protein MKZ20_20305 [Psychrobacillus sp. FSL K6-2684]|uniref:hypothetical protein n=1 Tax=Psychrobacillus sp. FSL K6-2684 TaxID=2921547 RepID=UPI0030F90FD3
MQTPTLQELEEDYMIAKFQILISQAYEQGVEDGRAKFTYPPVLTKQHLMEIFQIELPTVDKIIKDSTFPRLQTIRARYPRDAVFTWIDKNTAALEKYLT